VVRGEAGIGKSRLVEALCKRAEREGATQMRFRCSPYYQNSAFYPLIEQLQRFLEFGREDGPEVKLSKLERMMAEYQFAEADTAPLLAEFLSLPPPQGYAPLNLTPQRQRQKTQEALVAWLCEEASRQPVLVVWEDLHWIDPSSLEVLSLLMEEVAQARLCVLLAARPEFVPPWGAPAHLTPVELGRLGAEQIEGIVANVTGGRKLPAELLEQIASKTDGIPLFVEELTKMIVESGAVHAVNGHYDLTGPLSAVTIPMTLQDSLMARLDRLGPAKGVAQVGAVIGREFSYELLQAVHPQGARGLEEALGQLVAAELVYEQARPPQASYQFKHALIQDAAYGSLLRRTRRHYHHQIAQVLEGQFTQTVETQPELVAHHYTEAGLITQAIPYWQNAGQRAVQRSANAEAINHLTKGLELLKTLPDTPERTQQELTLQITLGPALIATKGYTAPRVEQTYSRARELCQQLEEMPRLFSVLEGLFLFYFNQGEFQTARELAEQLFSLAQSVQDPAFLMRAYSALGYISFRLGELVPAQEHFEQALTLYDSQKHSPYASGGVQDSRILNLSYTVWNLWLLGYPDQALGKNYEALTLAQELSHPYSLAIALNGAIRIHQLRREEQVAQEQAEVLIALSTEQGFALPLNS